MDEATLKKLQDNPFYKMSAKQKAGIEPVKKEMQPFGDVEIHDNTPVVTKGKIIRRSRNAQTELH